ALGVFIGIKIENKLSIGQLVVRIISNHDSSDLLKNLKENNFNFTTMEATGKFGPVKIIYIIIQRHLLNKTTEIIEASNNSTFYTIEDVRYVKGNLPGGKNPILNSLNPFHRN
ncbi:MAG: cyclic-di-AMP receptor, partial [Fibromonadales bacterium]|nr:cyclic-di-AMP receptor [Fibromonadales bacterium]